MPVHGFDSWMKRLSRPGLLMLAVLVLGVGLVACGGGDDEEDSGGSDADDTAPASTPLPTTAVGPSAAAATSLMVSAATPLGRRDTCPLAICAAAARRVVGARARRPAALPGGA